MVTIPAITLIDDDGIPIENQYHRHQQQLMLESLHHHWRNRTDFYAGANMFVYFSRRQAENILRGDTKEYRGPDFFVVLGVDFHRRRTCWVVWEEDGRYPDVIVEILSPSTAQVDRIEKKQLYAEVFGTEEYFLLDFDEKRLEGFELVRGEYQPKEPNERGWLWSAKLGVWLGFWRGTYLGREEEWLRFFTREGELVLTGEEAAQRAAEQARLMAEVEHQRAEQEHQRAEQERQRAEEAQRQAEAERMARESAEAELERLRRLLAERGIQPE